MSKAIVPVVLQILAEADPSLQRELQGLLGKVSQTSKQAADQSLRLGQQTSQALASPLKQLSDELQKSAQRLALAGQKVVDSVAGAAAAAQQKAQKAGEAAATAVAGAQERAKRAVRSTADETERAAQRATQNLRKQADGFTDFLARAGRGLGASITGKLNIGRGSPLSDLTELSGLGRLVGGLNLAGFGSALDTVVSKLGNLGTVGESVFRGLLTVGAPAIAALDAALVALGTAAVSTAAKFQTYHVQLETVLKSRAAADRVFARSLEVASKTPFDVQEIVAATVTMNVFGQTSEKALTTAINLAAGMNKKLDETSLAVAKAKAGSLEGFETLRNTFGITNQKLAEQGALLDKNGSLILNTTAALEKASSAIDKLVEKNFGDAVERQSKTFLGALSNLGDELLKLADAGGQVFLPLATELVKFGSEAVKAINAVSTSTKTFVLFITGLGAVVGTAVSAIVLLSGTLSLADKAVKALLADAGLLATEMAGGVAPAMTAAAAATEAYALASEQAAGASALQATRLPLLTQLAQRLAPGLEGAAGAASGMAASLIRLSPVLALIGVATAAAFSKLERFRRETEAADAASTESLKAFQDSQQSIRTYTEVLEKATGAHLDFAKSTTNVVEVQERLAKLLKDNPQLAVFQGLKAAGFTNTSFDQDKERLKRQAEANDVSRLDLEKILHQIDVGVIKQGTVIGKPRQVPGVLGFPSISRLYPSGRVDLNQEQGPEGERLRARFGEDVGIDQLRNALELETKRKDQIAKEAVLTEQLADNFKKTSDAISKATEEAQRLDKFFQFASKLDDVQGLNAAIQEQVKSLNYLEKTYADLNNGAGLDTASLLKALANADDETGKLITSILKGRDSLKSLEGKAKEITANETKERIRNLEFSFELEKSLTQKNELEKQRKVLDSELAIVAGSGKIREGYAKQLEDLNKKIAAEADGRRREELIRQRDHLRQEIAAVEYAAEQEIAIRNKQAELNAQILARETKKVSEGIQGRLKGVREQASTLAGGGEIVTGARRAALFEGAIRELEQIEQRQKALLKQSPELRAEFEHTYQALRTEARKARQEIPDERLRLLRTNIDTSLTELEEPAQRLQAINEGIKLIQDAQTAGLIKQRDAEAAILSYKRARLPLEQQIQKTNEAQLRELEQVRGSRVGSEISLLQARRDEPGTSSSEREQIDKRIGKFRDQELETRLLAIKQEEAAEVAAHKNRALAAEKAKQKTEQLFTEETTAYIRNLQQQDEAFKKSLENRLGNLQENRLGGAASPLQSLEEIGVESALQFNTPTRPFARHIPSPQEFAAQFAGRTGFQLDPTLFSKRPNPYETLGPLKDTDLSVNQTITVQVLDAQGNLVSKETKNATTKDGGNSDLHFTDKRMRTDSQLGRGRR